MGFGQETDNADKWEREGVEGRILRRFRARVAGEVKVLGPRRVLDVGCGEGYVTTALSAALPGAEVVGVEPREEAREAAAACGVTTVAADARSLPFADGEWDVVVCTEVLEHLDEPGVVLRELVRVAGGSLLVTVPWEPFFRLGNLARGRYVRRLGSTPGHVSTWGRRGFTRVVGRQAEPVRWIGLFPWQGVLARPRRP